MNDLDIRQSLNYQTYIEHSKSLKYAGDENLNLFLSNTKNKNTSLQVGLHSSTMLLYAVSIELILKARGLYEEKEEIKMGNVKNYREFLKRWGGNFDGHNFFKIIDHYNLIISEKHQKIFNELISFTTWAGRFPFPKPENETLQFENGNGQRGKLNSRFEKEIELFILNQIIIMR
tara:strand:+ start:670 stop:1194 length:525 start_codon:yes stop_codon:yes gene_type:complete